MPGPTIASPEPVHRHSEHSYAAGPANPPQEVEDGREGRAAPAPASMHLTRSVWRKRHLIRANEYR